MYQLVRYVQNKMTQAMRMSDEAEVLETEIFHITDLKSWCKEFHFDLQAQSMFFVMKMLMINMEESREDSLEISVQPQALYPERNANQEYFPDSNQARLTRKSADVVECVENTTSSGFCRRAGASAAALQQNNVSSSNSMDHQGARAYQNGLNTPSTESSVADPMDCQTDVFQPEQVCKNMII